MSKTLNMVGGGANGLFASILATGVSQSDTVTLTTPSGKIKSGKWTSKPNPASHGLPAEYQEVEYLRGDGAGAYINTGLTTATNWRALLDLEFTDTNNRQLITGANSGSAEQFICFQDGKFVGYLGGTSFETSAFGIGRYLIDFIAFSTGSSVLVNGTKVVTGGTNFNRTKNILLFTHTQGGTVQEPEKEGYGYFKLYGGKYYQGAVDTLVRDYVPCYIKATGEAGLYDLVSGAFFGNAGSGTFTVGADVPDSIDSLLFDKLGESGIYKITAIRATDGKTDFKEIYIDAAVEYEVSGFYVFYLYKTGDEFEDITGGWSQTVLSNYSSYASLKKNEDSMLFYVANANYYGVLFPNNKIDFTNYTKLHIDGDFQFKQSYEGSIVYTTFVNSSKPSGSNANTTNGCIGTPIITDIGWNSTTDSNNGVISTQLNSLQEIEYDVSTITGSYYLWLRGDRGIIEMTYKNIWLE